MMDVILKRFENPDETRVFEKGKFEIVEIGGMTIGRATYEPGWKWSEHVGKAMDATSCQVEHVGMVVSGSATAAGASARRPWSRFRTCSSGSPAKPARRPGAAPTWIALAIRSSPF